MTSLRELSGGRRIDPAVLLDAWVDAQGWERVLNRKGNTWRLLDDPADAAARRRSAAGKIQEQPPGKPSGQIAQPLVGGPGELGEQRQHLVGVVEQSVGDGGLVELSDLGRDLFEARVAGEVAPRSGSLSRLGDRCVGRLALAS